MVNFSSNLYSSMLRKRILAFLSIWILTACQQPTSSMPKAPLISNPPTHPPQESQPKDLSGISPEEIPLRGKIAFVSDRDGQHKVYIMNADGSMQFRLTNLVVSEEHRPQWSPDGTRIAFASTVDNNIDIYLVNADGSNLIRLTEDIATDTNPIWSPDGKHLAF